MEPKFLVVDLFCGAGGTTTGFLMAGGVAKVIACVNHDPGAIDSHWQNHPEVHHFEEDIRTLKLDRLQSLCNYQRALHPGAKLILWASLECTNFSKAKGGQPRDADSRTLADHLDRYVIALEPDYIQIENVVEFMSWGPLDANGKPISRKNGNDWMRWRGMICEHGYRDEWRELNSANYGAFTSRNRLFGVFAKDGLPISWPAATHAKKPVHGSTSLTMTGLGNLKKWKAVKEVLDFSDEGKSIFDRKKPLCEKTLERIYEGLIKFVAGGKEAFILKYNSTSLTGKHYPPSIDEPCHTIAVQNRLGVAFIAKYYSGRPEGKIIPVTGPAGTIKCIDGQSLVQTSFIAQRNSGNPEGRIVDVNGPARTLTATGGNQDIVQTSFLANYYGSGGQLADIENPCPVVPTKDRQALIGAQYLLSYHHSSKTNDITQPCPALTTTDRAAIINTSFIYKAFTTGDNNQSIEQPTGAIMPIDKHSLVSTEKYHSYLINPSWGGNPSDTELPCPVVVARQDKAPLYLVVSEAGDVAIRIDEGDSECIVKIKEFMVLYGIIDIKMRMLRVDELLRIQGFPDGYVLTGTQADRKKFIGNSVVPQVVKAWVEAMAEKFVHHLQNVA